MKSPICFNAPPNIKKVASSIAEAADTAIDAYREGRISDEPNTTERRLGAVENTMRTYWQPRSIRRGKPGVIWQAKTLRTGRGIAAEEKRHGADLLGVAEIHIGGRMIRKGFLGQSKRTEAKNSRRDVSLELPAFAISYEVPDFDHVFHASKGTRKRYQEAWKDPANSGVCLTNNYLEEDW